MGETLILFHIIKISNYNCLSCWEIIIATEENSNICITMMNKIHGNLSRILVNLKFFPHFLNCDFFRDIFPTTYKFFYEETKYLL